MLGMLTDEGRMDALFDYYYGKESESFTFIRIPKMLFTDEPFKGLSIEAKFLYGLMHDRMSLSRSKDWFDEEGRVYIVYTVSEIAEGLGCSENKASKVLGELDSKKGIGLIERKRRGLGMPDLIYVKNFISFSTGNDGSSERYHNGDSCSEENEFQEPQKMSFRKRKSCGYGNAENDVQEPRDLRPNNTNMSNTEFNNTNILLSSSQPPDLCPPDQYYVEQPEAERETGPEGGGYQELIRENIALDDILEQADPKEKDIANAMFKIMCDVVSDKGDGTVKILGRDILQKVVRSRFLKISRRHFEYALRQVSEQYWDIKALKPYVRTVLYRSLDVPEDKLGTVAEPAAGKVKAISGKPKDIYQAWKRASYERDWSTIGKLLNYLPVDDNGYRLEEIRGDPLSVIPGDDRTKDNKYNSALKAACV